MSLAIRLQAEALRSLAFGSISAVYAGIGTSFAKPIRILNVQNLTDQTLLFSFNGIDDHFILPTEGFIILDVTTNKSLSQGWYIAEGTRLYVRDNGTPTTSGAVYVSAFYGGE